MKIKRKIKGERILTISDIHAPYHHTDTLAFLAYLKKQIQPTLVVQVGDLKDFHGISFHDSDPDLDSAGVELDKAQKFCSELEELFPEMYILGSNHGDLPARKAKAHGLPKKLLKSYNDIYGVDKGWKFVDDLLIEDKEQKIYFAHGIAKDGLKLVKERGVCTVQGHFHTEFNIKYASTPYDLLWSMQVGCLIDKNSLAFAYNKLDLSRPIIGSGSIVNGRPYLHPMLLNSKSRWIKPN